MTTWNAVPKHDGMSKKCLRVQRTLFFTRTTKKTENRRKTLINLSLYFGDFRGSLVDLRRAPPISVTATPLLVQCRVVEDFHCLRRADNRWNVGLLSSLAELSFRVACRGRCLVDVTTRAWSFGVSERTDRGKSCRNFFSVLQ